MHIRYIVETHKSLKGGTILIYKGRYVIRENGKRGFVEPTESMTEKVPRH